MADSVNQACSWPTGRANRALRLLAAPPLPALPSADDLLGAGVPRRPGEFHEGLPLPADLEGDLACRAAQVGVTVDVAASVLLEAALLVADLDGAPSDDLGPVGESCAGEALPQAAASYLRSLTVGRRARPTRSQAVVAVPVRLVARLRGIEVGWALRAVDLETALAWEIAAMRAARTMTEWALLRAVRARD